MLSDREERFLRRLHRIVDRKVVSNRQRRDFARLFDEQPERVLEAVQATQRRLRFGEYFRAKAKDDQPFGDKWWSLLLDFLYEHWDEILRVLLTLLVFIEPPKPRTWWDWLKGKVGA